MSRIRAPEYILHICFVFIEIFSIWLNLFYNTNISIWKEFNSLSDFQNCVPGPGIIGDHLLLWSVSVDPMAEYQG